MDYTAIDSTIAHSETIGVNVAPDGESITLEIYSTTNMFGWVTTLTPLEVEALRQVLDVAELKARDRRQHLQG